MDELETEVRRLFAPRYTAAARAARAWLESAPSDSSRFSITIGPDWLGCSVSGLRKDRIVSLTVRRQDGGSSSRETAWETNVPTPGQSALLEGLEESGPTDVLLRLKEVMRDMSAMGLSPAALSGALSDALADHVMGE